LKKALSRLPKLYIECRRENERDNLNETNKEDRIESYILTRNPMVISSFSGPQPHFPRRRTTSPCHGTDALRPRIKKWLLGVAGRGEPNTEAMKTESALSNCQPRLFGPSVAVASVTSSLTNVGQDDGPPKPKAFSLPPSARQPCYPLLFIFSALMFAVSGMIDSVIVLLIACLSFLHGVRGIFLEDEED